MLRAKFVRLLLIEDSEEDALLVQKELEKFGFQLQIHRVQSREEVKKALLTQEWDLVITDYSLPSFNAFGVIGLVKEFGFDCPILVVSGAIGEEIAVETMNFGAHDYIMKNNLKKLGPAALRELSDAESRERRRRAEADRASVEKQLKLERDFTYAVIEAAGCLIIVLDRSGRVHYFNHVSEEVTGFMAHEVRGKFVWDQIFIKDEKNFWEKFFLSN